jgi:hypothetical protein
MTEIDTPFPSPLIFASKVKGTPVFSVRDERIGHIDDIAIGKTTGQVAYAVLAAGGFLGAGERRYPIPWRMLTYDTSRNGYIATVDKEQLRNAPSYDKAELADMGDTDESWVNHWGPFI